MTAAGAYARLLLEQELPPAALERLRELARDPLLGEALENPVYDRREKGAVIRRLFPPEARPFLALLCDRGDYGLLGGILEELEALLRARDGVVKVTFTCCHEPAPDQREQVEALVRRRFGARGVEWHTVHDPAILGGFILTVDDWVLDRSLRTAAQTLRQQLSLRQ